MKLDIQKVKLQTTRSKRDKAWKVFEENKKKVLEEEKEEGYLIRQRPKINKEENRRRVAGVVVLVARDPSQAPVTQDVCETLECVSRKIE